jgi:hypothetical protein
MSEYDRSYDPDNGDLMTVADYLESVKSGCLMDCDGFGFAVKDGMERVGDYFSKMVQPSKPSSIPADATHIAWYNK